MSPAVGMSTISAAPAASSPEPASAVAPATPAPRRNARRPITRFLCPPRSSSAGLAAGPWWWWKCLPAWVVLPFRWVHTAHRGEPPDHPRRRDPPITALGGTGFGHVTEVTSCAHGRTVYLFSVTSPVDRLARLENGEDAERGREARGSAPRPGHADWAPARTRPDPVETLHRQTASRLAELVPIRYGRMLATPFTFFRGAAAVMAADLADTPSSGLVVQACGDAHISNFGGFAAPDRRLVFGPNDFDETLPGPWEWDVKRMAASIEIAGRDIDLPPRRRRLIIERALCEYREGMREFARESFLDAWYERLDADELTARFGTKLDADGHQLFVRTFQKGRRKTSARAVQKLTEEVDGKLRFVSVPPLLTPLHELYDAGPNERRAYVLGLLEQYIDGLHADRQHLVRSYEVADMARKVVGIGSVGTRAWVILLVG